MQGGFTARFQQALRHKTKGEYGAALTLFRALAAEQPTNADVYHAMGLTYSYQIQIDEATAALEKAVALAPRSRHYLEDLAKTFALFGMYDEAKRAFERLLEWPDDDDGGGGTPALLRV